MRASLFFAFFGLAALLAPAALSACAESSPANTDAPATVATGATLPAPSKAVASAPTDASAPAVDSAPPKPKNDCKLAALTGVADVDPTFVVNSPGTPPPTMTGGTLKGEYRVDKAVVYLPSASAGIVDVRATTGLVNSWALFNGTNYRLYLKADFVISTTFGPQMQGADSASQGGFTTMGPVLTLDHACDTAIADEADYSFTDLGSGRATILIKTPSPYGDIYFELDAAAI